MAEEENSSGRSRRRSRFLPQELQEEILVRLPIQSLGRFKSVCKTWLSMFHSHGFSDMYGLFGRCDQRDSSSEELHSISTANLRKMVPGLAKQLKQGCWRYLFRVLGPLNGIYCIASYLYDTHRGRYSILSAKIALCNPATHDHKFTNPFPRKFRSLLSNISSKQQRAVHLGFGALKTKATWDYRVVLLINYDFDLGSADNSSFLVLVYSVQKGVWEKIVHYQPGKRNAGQRKATDAFDIQSGGSRIVHISPPLEVCPQRFFEGCYYWMAATAGEDHEPWYALSFNFAEESFKLIRLPTRSRAVDTVEQECKVRGEVFVLHHRLAAVYLFTVLSNDGVRSTVEVGVWMMMDYGVEESWTRIHTIKPNFISQLYSLQGIHYCPLKSAGGIRIKRLLFRDDEQIIFCDDVGYQVIRLTARAGSIQLSLNTPGISTYTETLERP